MASPKDRLTELGLTLPPVAKPVAAYVPAVQTGRLLFISGQIPMLNGKLLCTGPVPSSVSIDQAKGAAKQCALNALAIVNEWLDGHLERVARIVRLGVFVCSDPEFADQPKVANGASELLQDVFGECGRHARAAVGSIALPLGATVEVEMLVELSE